MAMLRILCIAMATIFLVEATMAVNHAVGVPRGGWDLSANLTAWAYTQTFTKGDNLVFSYNPSYHNVLEVTKANYDTCTASNPRKSYSTGNDIIQLSSVGTKYFICGIPGHCALGMKVQIDTVAASAAPASSPTPSPRISPSTSPTISPSVSPRVSPSVIPRIAPSVSVAAPPSYSPSNKPTDQLTPTTTPIESSPLPAPHSGANNHVAVMNSTVTFAFGLCILLFLTIL